MMLADAEVVDTDLFGKHTFGDNVAQRLRLRDQLAVSAGGDVAERIQTQFNHARRPLRL
jgi:hypothetical protein